MLNARQAQLVMTATLIGAAACYVVPVRAGELTRLEVQQQTLAAARHHAIPRNDAEIEKLAMQEALAGPSVSRGEVRAETLSAIARHEIPHNDQEVQRQLAAADDEALPVSRAQVKAETREAIRLGLIPHGEADVVATPEQLARVRFAGERAAATSYASSSR